jgi:hypothetical protein
VLLTIKKHICLPNIPFHVGGKYKVGKMVTKNSVFYNVLDFYDLASKTDEAYCGNYLSKKISTVLFHLAKSDHFSSRDQGCQIIYFKTQSPNFGIFWRPLERKMSAIWYNAWPFGVVCAPLVYFSRFGMFGPIKIWQPRA